MDKELASVIDAAGIRPALRSYWRIRNELTPSFEVNPKSWTD